MQLRWLANLGGIICGVVRGTYVACRSECILVTNYKAYSSTGSSCGYGCFFLFWTYDKSHKTSVICDTLVNANDEMHFLIMHCSLHNTLLTD